MRQSIARIGTAVLIAVAAPQANCAQSEPKVINEPNRLDWDYYGSGYKLKPIKDPAIPGGGAAVEVEVKKGDQPYAAGTNIPLTAPIVAGRDYVLRFWARTLSSSANDDKGQIVVRFFRNSDPYPGFGDRLVEVGPEWRAYEVTARATMDIPAQAAVALQLASATQRLQIGQATVAEGATTLAGQSVRIAPPDPLPPQLAGKGELINDPANRSWVIYGDAQSAKPTTTDVYTRKAVLLTVSAAGQNSWDAGVNAPIIGAIANGEILRIAFLARSRSAKTADGMGLVRARIQSNQPPYDGFGETDFNLASNWRLYQWRVEAQTDLPAHGSEVAIHTGLAKQEIEIGPIYVIREPKAP